MDIQIGIWVFGSFNYGPDQLKFEQNKMTASIHRYKYKHNFL